MTVLTKISAKDAQEVVAKINGLTLAQKRSASAKKARRASKKARMGASEADIQRAVCQHLSLLERQGRLLYFAIPNGGTRHIVEAVNMKKTGTRKGVPDLCIVPKTGPVCFIELKSESGRVSPEQQAWMDALKEHGCPAEVCRSLDEVKQFLIVNAIIRDVA